MKQTHKFTTLILLAALITSCSRSPQCPDAIQNECEAYKDRSYPQLNITNDPNAWYEATIEDRVSTVGTGFEEEGIVYYGTKGSAFTTTDPQLNPGQVSKSYEYYSMSFSLYKPKGFVGKTTGLISFHSPAFDKDTIDYPITHARYLFSPGIKAVDNGKDNLGQWKIKLDIKEKIESANQTNMSGIPLASHNALRTVDFNQLEITDVAEQDFGTFVRFTIWIDFQAEIYRYAYENPSLYFGPIQAGKAKLYVDVQR